MDSKLLDFNAMEQELIKAFIKAVSSNDFEAMLKLNNLKAEINRYKRKENKDHLKSTYYRVCDVMKKVDYMFWERKHILALLNGVKAEDLNFGNEEIK